MRNVPQAQLAGVQKPPRHEVAGSWAPASSERYVDLMMALISIWPGRQHDAACRCGRRRGRASAIGIFGWFRSVTRRDRRTDGCYWAKRDRRRREAGAWKGE